jgi:hypothetical protein
VVLLSNPVDLSGDIALAVNGAPARGHQLVIGYIDEDGYPATSYRGSTQVYSPTQLAIWARKPDSGIARSIVDRPKVTLVYYGPGSPGPLMLSFRGRARIDPSANDRVYSNMIEIEQKLDPERKGVAIIIDVEQVRGYGSAGRFEQGHPSRE